jgi:hypothetical protein
MGEVSSSLWVWRRSKITADASTLDRLFRLVL